MGRATSLKTIILLITLGVGSLMYFLFVWARTDGLRVCYESRRNKLGLLSEEMVDNKNHLKIIAWCALHGNPPEGWPTNAHRQS